MFDRQNLSAINAIREENKLLYGTKGLPQIRKETLIMKTKVVEFMDNHASAIVAGAYAVGMGICVIMYKRYLNDLSDTTDVFTKKVES